MDVDVSDAAFGEDLMAPVVNPVGTISKVLYPIGGGSKSGYINRAEGYNCHIKISGVDAFYLEYSYTQESETKNYIATVKIANSTFTIVANRKKKLSSAERYA
jgi:hypothetical protein